MLNQQILEAVLQGQLIFCWIIGGNATPNAGVVLFQWAQIDIGEQKMFDEGVEHDSRGRLCSANCRDE